MLQLLFIESFFFMVTKTRCNRFKLRPFQVIPPTSPGNMNLGSNDLPLFQITPTQQPFFFFLNRVYFVHRNIDLLSIPIKYENSYYTNNCVKKYGNLDRKEGHFYLTTH